MGRRIPFPLVLTLFFLSGATGLVYQVLWVRMFSFLFGATVPAVATVLAAFMGGLALGGLWAGRTADRWKHPLRLYGMLEALLGLYAAAVPMLLRAADPLYSALYGPLEQSLGALTAVRFVVSVILLLPPTFLMGATLPVLTRFVAPASGGRGRVAHLYATNTFGAVAGTVAATFALLPALGLHWTLAAAVAGNLLVAATAFALGGAETPAEKASGTHVTPPIAPGRRTAGSLPFPRPLLYVATAVLGFSALALEVLWTRALSLSLGTSTYAFAIVLSVFLVGIAGGSALAARWMNLRATAALFAACPAVIGLSALALLPVFDRLPDFFVQLTARGGGTWGESVAVKFALAGIPLLVPTLVSGAAFPLAVALDRASSGHRAVGDLYAANTLGAILGSWAAGFVLLRAFGLQGGIEVAAAPQVAATIVLFLLWRGPAAARARAAAVVAAAAAGTAWITLPAWDLTRMTRGGFVLGSDLQRSGQSSLGDDDAEVIFLEEGVTTTVTVRRDADGVTMQMNGVTEASTAGDLSTQVSVAALPLVLHGKVEDALVIGLGGGITAATAARYPGVRSVDCVEISRAVVHAAAAHFSRANRGVLHDPRFRLIVGDGRNHVALTDRSYDAIVSLPSHVWNAGIGSLMSGEFYSLCRKRLRPGGVVCQWIQGYALSADALRSVLAAMRQSFDSVTLWRGAWGDLLIVAGDGLRLDAGQLLARGRDPVIGAILRDADAPDLASLLSLNLLAGERLDAWVGDAAPNTDDRPTLEFAAPKLLYADPMPALFTGLHAAAGGTEEALTNAPAGLKESLPRWRRARAAESGARLALRDGQGEVALRQLEEAFGLLPTAPSIRRTLAGTLNQRGAGLARRGEPGPAAQSYTHAIEVDPDLPDSYENLARLYLQAGQVSVALDLVEEGLGRSPDAAGLHATRASILLRTRRFAEAREAAARNLELRPDDPDGHALLADAFEQLGEPARAESTLVAGLTTHPGSEELAARLRKLRTSSGK